MRRERLPQTIILACIVFSDQGATAELTVPVGASFTVPASATLQMGCADLHAGGTSLLNAGLIEQAGNITVAANGAFDGGNGTIQVGGNWSNNGTFIAGSSTVIFVDGCATTPAILTGDTQFNNLILTSQTGRTFVVEAGRNIGVSGSLAVQGTPAAPVNLVTSSQTGQVAYITLAAGATYTATDATIPPNVRIVDQTPTPPPQPNPIPTLGDWGRLLLMLVLVLTAIAKGFPRKRFHT